MRLNPQLYWKMLDPKTGLPGGTDHDILTGDAYVSHGTAPWISEMYGYVFAAGEAGLRHILTHGVVVYPDDIGAGQPQEPSIIHYGLHCTVGSFHFTKYTHGMFDAVGCTGETFGDPPLPGHLERLCAETVLTLNDAMCDYYARDKQHGGCGFPEIGRTVPTCPAWKAPKMRSCSDKHEECKGWASSGECTKNPGFMLGACPKACDQCGVAGMVKVPAWARGYALANGEAAPYMRGVFDGPVPVNSEPGISLEGAGTVVRESGWATASKLTGSLTSRLRAAGKASGAKLRGAGAGLDTADALEREAGAGGETRKKRKLHPMPGFNASGIGERKLPGLAYGEGNADAGGAGGALHGAAAEAARQEAAAQVLRDAAARATAQRATARRRRSLRPATRAAAARSRRCAGKCMSAGRRSSCSAPLWSAANSAGSRRSPCQGRSDHSRFECIRVLCTKRLSRRSSGHRSRQKLPAPNPNQLCPNLCSCLATSLVARRLRSTTARALAAAAVALPERKLVSIG